MYDCLANIVGILGDENECLPDINLEESLSGLYLDDTTAGLIMIGLNGLFLMQ